MHQVITDKRANPYQSATVSATMTDGFHARFVPHANGGFVTAVTQGWGIVKTVVKTNRVFQLSPGALGIRSGE